MKIRGYLLAFFLFALGALCSHGQTVYTWLGITDDIYLTHDENWVGGVIPPDDILNTQLLFGNRTQTHVRYYQVYVNKITFSGNTLSYFIEGDYDTTHIGSGGIVYAPSGNITSALGGRIQLEANQTWDIQSGGLDILSSITNNPGSFSITKNGAGTLSLHDNYSDFSGGFTLNAGRVEVFGYDDGSVSPFGTGTLTLNGGSLATRFDVTNYYYQNDYTELTNAVVINGPVHFYNQLQLFFSGPSVTLGGSVNLDVNGALMDIDAPIGESVAGSRLTMSGYGKLYLEGQNTYSGGTDSTNGAIIFANLLSLPANPATNAFKAGANGYIGISVYPLSTPYNYQTAFVDRFDKANTFGTVGIDTEITDNVSLAGFGSTARLGSATEGNLSGFYTPVGSTYNFGGGGGYLDVSSQLTGTRNVSVDSPVGAPLTLRLSAYNNDFTGNISVTNSALIFAATSLPSGGRTITIGTGGYVSTENGNSGSTAPDDADIAYFFNHIALGSVGVVGFDLEYGDYNELYDRPIDLSAFTGALYLGTATRGYTDDGVSPGILIAGPITTTNGGTAPYRFAGYKGGLLEVDSVLTGTQGVIIGDPNSPATFSDPSTGERSGVFLGGNNSGLSGDIQLYGGLLIVGQANGAAGTDPTSALGSGTLVVNQHPLAAAWTAVDTAPNPAIYTAGDIIIPNAITLNTTLRVLYNSGPMRLSGAIQGTGGLYLEEYTSLGLSNDANSFTGGIYLSKYSTLDVNANHATGSGALYFGGGTDSTVNFATASPVISGLVSDNTYDYTSIYAALSNTALTINQAFDSTFRGSFYALTDNVRVIKNGVGTLALDDGGIYYSQGTVEASLPLTPKIALQVNQGTVVLNEYFSLNNNDQGIWVHGGTLTLNNNYSYIEAPIYVDNGGRLQGSGTVYNAVTLSSGTVLSPGVRGASQIGYLTFDDLRLMGGAKLEVNIQNPNASDGVGWDTVAISEYSYTLHVDSSVTPGTPYTIKLITLDANGNPGTAVGFLNQMYTWTIFDASQSSIVFDSGSFNPAAFAIDSSGFSADVGPGNFAFVQNGDLLQLTFTPVPEPSAYALLGLGVLSLAGLYRRKKR